MILAYTRVSTKDQNLDGQRDAVTAAGAEQIFRRHAYRHRQDPAWTGPAPGRAPVRRQLLAAQTNILIEDARQL